MKALIKSITLTMFKGVKNATYTFDGKSVDVKGKNGVGKTTIATAFYWLFADKDYELNSNPNVRPMDAEECTPRVDVVLDVDGREITVAKIQKQSKKRDGSIVLSNTYEVNSVEYGERDFKLKLLEYGIDTTLFLALSHPDVFTGKKSDEMRKVLFGMVEDVSDKDIADNHAELSDVAKLLTDYTVEEITAMQNATLRKVKEVYGKDGEILRATIEGLELSKSGIEASALEIERNLIREKIAENEKKQSDFSQQLQEREKLASEIMNLKFELSGLQNEKNRVLEEQRREINAELSKVNSGIRTAENSKLILNRDIDRLNAEISKMSERLVSLREKYKTASDVQFDDSSLACPYCKQEYPTEEKDRIKADFEKNKNKELADITAEGNSTKALIEQKKKEVEQYVADIDSLDVTISELTSDKLVFEKNLSEIPTTVDVTGTEEYKKLSQQISEKEQQLSTMSNYDEQKAVLSAERNELNAELVSVEKKFFLCEHDSVIDEQIAEHRKKQSGYEQNKADAEKILEQLKELSRRKNELLTDDIDKHFDIVRWQLFEYQKNGEVKNCCVPLVDGRRFGESTNTGRDVLAKLDIINGLQRFYGQNYPVFLDGAECLSSETKNRIKSESQLICLTVTESDKLEVE